MDNAERLVLIRRVCRRDALEDGGKAVAFSVTRAGRDLAAFVIAYAGSVHAYVNVCPHRGTPLDWQPGEVFDETRLYLICATHGALFEPQTGQCIAGPCQGACLQKISVREDGAYVVLEHDFLSNFIES